MVGIRDTRNAKAVVRASFCCTNSEDKKGQKSGGLHSEGLVCAVDVVVERKERKGPKAGELRGQEMKGESKERRKDETDPETA